MDRAGRLHPFGSPPLACSEIPVSKQRRDEAYYAAREGWKQPAGARLHLGLRNRRDATADSARVAVSRGFANDFVALADCGRGRVETGPAPELLKMHRAGVEEF